MSAEIERKFVVEAGNIPAYILMSPPEQLLQAYLEKNPDGSEVRIRKIVTGLGSTGVTHEMTRKGAIGLVRDEENTPIDEATFDQLWADRIAEVSKDRYSLQFQLINDHTATLFLDIYHGSLVGLHVAEVEFLSEEDARLFQPLGWFGGEVTEYNTYNGEA
jgi:adenylate cyclase